MDEVVTEARAPNSAVRAHAFPALESGNISFPDGRYVVGFEPGTDGSSFTVRHRIEGAALINDVIADRSRAVRLHGGVPGFFLSRLVTCPGRSTQVIGWGSERLGGAADVHADGRGGGAVREDFGSGAATASTSSGTDGPWRSRGACGLALSDVVLMRSSVLNMLLFERDPTLSDGEFRVEAEDREGFRFRVHLALDLHRFLKYDSENRSPWPYRHPHRRALCFGVLKIRIR